MRARSIFLLSDFSPRFVLLVLFRSLQIPCFLLYRTDFGSKGINFLSLFDLVVFLLSPMLAAVLENVPMMICVDTNFIRCQFPTCTSCT